MCKVGAQSHPFNEVFRHIYPTIAYTILRQIWRLIHVKNYFIIETFSFFLLLFFAKKEGKKTSHIRIYAEVKQMSIFQFTAHCSLFTLQNFNLIIAFKIWQMLLCNQFSRNQNRNPRRAFSNNLA